MSIYQEVILDHYHSPRNFGKIATPTKSVTVNNPLCGDRIQLDIILKGNKVNDIKFSGAGCAISLAAASMLTEYAKNKTKDNLQKLDSVFMIKLLGVDLSPNRVRCAVLSLEALSKVLV